MDKFLLERYALKVGHDAGSPLIVTDRREVRGYSEFLFDHIVFSQWLVPGSRFKMHVEAVPQVVADMPHRRCLEIPM